MTTAPKTLGRPCTYTEEMGEEICRLTAEGLLLTEVSRRVGVDTLTMNRWARKYPIFGTAFEDAQKTGFDALADTLMVIPDMDADVQRARLRSDNIKFILAKRAPRVYGDRIDVNVTQTIDIGNALLEAKQRATRSVSDQRTEQIAEDVDFIDVSSQRPTDG